MWINRFLKFRIINTYLRTLLVGYGTVNSNFYLGTIPEGIKNDKLMVIITSN